MIARKWIFIVLSYYYVVFCYKILPWFAIMKPFNRAMMILQMVAATSILITNIASYKYAKWPIRYLLFFQSIQMSLSNFNQYQEGTDKEIIDKDNKIFLNWMALNVIVGIFTTMFTTFNMILLAFVSTEKEKTRTDVMISTTYGLNIFLIIFTNFKFEAMSDLEVITIIVSVIYTIVIVPSFLWIVNAILSEAIMEAKEAG
jgi:hypothetical protein